MISIKEMNENDIDLCYELDSDTISLWNKKQWANELKKEGINVIGLLQQYVLSSVSLRCFTKSYEYHRQHKELVMVLFYGTLWSWYWFSFIVPYVVGVGIVLWYHMELVLVLFYGTIWSWYWSCFMVPYGVGIGPILFYHTVWVLVQFYGYILFGEQYTFILAVVLEYDNGKSGNAAV